MKRFQLLKPHLEQIAYVKQGLATKPDFYKGNGREASPEERYYSLLGEVLVQDALKVPRVTFDGNDQGHDVLFNGTPIDVKVVNYNTDPNEQYEVTVLRSQLSKAPDNHYFLFLIHQDGNYYVAGIISKKGFYNVARYIKKGENIIPGVIDAETDIYRAHIYDLAPVEFGGIKMDETNKINWADFQSRFLRVEPGTQHRVKLVNWRQEQKSFYDEKPRPALVFDVVKVDDNDYTDEPLEWSTTSAALAHEFRRMIENAEKQNKEFLVVIMKRTSDKKYMLTDLGA